MERITGNTILLTGACGGLGEEWRKQLFAQGASKIYAACPHEHDYEDDRIIGIQVDLRDQADIDRMCEQVPDANVVINNAGVPLRDPILTLDNEKLREVFEINFFAPLRISQKLAHQLQDGALINVVSAMCWYGVSGGYSAVKASLWSITNSFRLELHSQNTHVLSVHMAYVDTPMTTTLQVNKITAESIVQQSLEALEKGEYEVIGDEITERIKSRLSLSVAEQYPQLSQ